MDIEGLLTTTELSIASPNILSEYANFNSPITFDIISGGTNILPQIADTRFYYGKSGLKITFTGTLEGKFNTGTSLGATPISKLRKFLPTAGLHILRYSVFKSDAGANVDLSVGIKIDGVELYKVNQNIYSTSGFEDGQFNTYFTSFMVDEPSYIDFDFYAKSDTTGCYIVLDGLKLELKDRGQSFPSIYSEAKTDVLTFTSTYTDITYESMQERVMNVYVGNILDIDNYYFITKTNLKETGLLVSSASSFNIGLDNYVYIKVYNHKGEDILIPTTTIELMAIIKP
jgi:hypothetical protein